MHKVGFATSEPTSIHYGITGLCTPWVRLVLGDIYIYKSSENMKGQPIS